MNGNHIKKYVTSNSVTPTDTINDQHQNNRAFEADNSTGNVRNKNDINYFENNA